MEFNDMGRATYIALETFRKSGEGVKTPVWVAEEGGALFVWTSGASGKVKRIRNGARVRIAVSDAQGNPKSEWLEAQARVLDAPGDEARQRERIRAKYGFQYRMIDLMSRFRRESDARVVVEIRPAPAA